MEDKSFINLTNEENLNHINIDQRLIETFKKVMKEMQEYFNANGYTEKINYEEYFKNYLIDKDFKIQVNDLPSKIGASGFYIKSKNMICIDEKYLNTEELQSSLCHEFIHFLVMHDKENKITSFINEALTESLTRQMYPQSNSYEPQVRMMDFANILANKKNNYSLFLQGGIDAKQISGDWKDFIEHINAYQEKYKNTNFNFQEAATDDNYIKAQRSIIRNNIHSHLIKKFSEYEEVLKILSKRPVKDEKWINEFIEKIEQNIVINIKNQKIRQATLNKFKEYRKIKQELENYIDEDKFQMEISGTKILISRSKKIYNEFSKKMIGQAYSPLFQLIISGKEMEINLEKIFLEKEKLKEKENQIRTFLTSMSLADEMALTSITDKDKLIKLEKIELPLIDTKKPEYVYIAVYQDRIELLNNATKIGTVNDLQISRYIGFNETCIVGEPLHKTDGIIYVPFSERQLKNRALSKYSSDINNDDVELSNFEKLPPEVKQKYIEEVQEKLPKFVIYQKEGEIEAGLMYGKKIAFKGKECTLIDPKGNGLFNDYFDAINNENANNQVVEFGQDKKTNTSEPSTPATLKERYDALDREIKKLIELEKKSVVPNYMERMLKLLDEQDEIKAEMYLKGEKIEKKKGTEEELEYYEYIEMLKSIQMNNEIERNHTEQERVEGSRRRL